MKPMTAIGVAAVFFGWPMAILFYYALVIKDREDVEW